MAWVVTGAVLVLIVAVLAAGWYFTRPAQLTPRIASVLERATGAEVSIERSEVSWRGGSVSIEGLRLSLPEDAKALVPEAAGEAMAEVFTAERVTVKLDVASLRSGTLALRSIEADGPALTVIEHDPTGHTNLELLQRARVREGPPPMLPETWPEVALNDAKLRRATLRDGERRLLGELALAGGVTAATGRKGVYRLDLRAPGTGAEADALRLLGEIDMTRLTGAFELVNLDLSPMQRALLPAELRRVWDRLDPDGSLPRVQLRVSPRFSLTGNPVDVQAEMELEDLAISLPIDALYSARMTGVSGSLRLRDGRLHMSSLRGDVEGIRYTLKGWLDAATPGKRFDLNLSTERFHVPNLPAIIPALPPAIQRSYRRLSPSGEFRLEVNVASDGPDEPTRYDGRVDVLDATARYEKFPYPAKNLEGLIRFSSNSVVIERLTGNTAGGGTVDITGSITPPGDGAHVEMTVKLRDVPLDDRLLAAMEPGHREAIDMMLHRPSLERLRDAGLIRTPDHEVDADRRADSNTDRSADPQAAPNAVRDASERGGVHRSASATEPGPYPFRAGGLLNADVDVFRPLGDDTRYLNTTTIHLAGLAGVFEHFPIPVTAQGGTVSFNRDEVRVVDAIARSPGGATIRAEGTIVGHGEDDGPITPDLRLTAEGGSINELMLFALPEAQAHQIRELQLDGDVAAEARIFRDAEQDRIAFAVEGRLADGRAQPFGNDVVFDDVRGGVRVHNDGFDLDAIRARLDDGELEVNGAWRFVDAGDVPLETPDTGEAQPDRETLADIALRVRGEDIPIHKRLAGLLPAGTSEPVRKRIASFDPAGETDFHLTLARPVRDGATAPLDVALTLEPRRLAVTLQDRRLDFRDVRGSIHYEDAGIEIDRLRAVTDEGIFGVSGLIDLGGDAGAALSLDADCSEIGPVFRTAVPAGAMSVLDRLEWAGGFATRSARLRITPAEQNRDDKSTATTRLFRSDLSQALRNARVLLAADLALDGVSADVGVPVEDLHGQAELRVQADGDAPRLTLRIDAERAEVLDRRVGRTRLDVDNQQHPRRFDIELRGRAAGGVLLGQGIAETAGPDPGYRIRLDLLDAELDPLLHPEDFPPREIPVAADAVAPLPTTSAESDVSDPVTAAVPLALATRKLERGIATASLTVDGSFEDPSERRGRGAIAVREAALFDAPLGMAVLQSVNLSLPDSRAFDHVACRWTLEGDLVTIDELTFETPSFAVTGAGYMRLPTTTLDLQMVTRVTGRAGLGKLGDAFNLFKDEIIDIRITGTLEDPRTRVESFQGLRNTWLRLFGGQPRTEPQPPPLRSTP